MTLFSPGLSADMSRCIRCGACNSSCPVYSLYDHSEPKSPRSWIQLSSSIQKGDLAVSVDFIEFMYGCTQCALCSGACPVGLDPSGIILRVRKEMIDQGYVPPMPVAALPEEVLGGRVFPTPSETVSPRSGGRPVYLSGCWTSSAPEIDVAASSALERLGIEAVRFQDQTCGIILKYAGYFDQEREVLEVTMKETADSPYLISACPEQIREIKSKYPEVDVRFLFDLVRDDLEEKRLRGLRYLIVSDCRVRSYGELMAQVIESAGADVIMAPKELCCSCGHLVTHRAQPDVAGRLAGALLKEAIEVSADVILFSNPACYGLLSELIKLSKRPKFTGRLSEPAEELLLLLR